MPASYEFAEGDLCLAKFNLSVWGTFQPPILLNIELRVAEFAQGKLYWLYLLR